MSLYRFRLLSGLVWGISLVILAAGCTKEVTTSPGVRTANTKGGKINPIGGGVKPTDPTDTKNAEGEKFFSDEVQRAFKAATSPRCLDCHDAPRNVLNNPDAADEKIYDYSTMRALLLEGEFATDNPVIDPMLTNTPHPGPRICSAPEDELCALIVEWWNIETGGDGKDKIGELTEINFDGRVSGFAISPSDKSQVLKVKAYVGGDKDSGALAFETDANQSTKINGIQQPYGFRGSIPQAMISNDEDHFVHVYALVDGSEVELPGSPIQTKLYAPVGQAGVAGIISIPNNCNGCHAVSYTSLYAHLTSPDPRDAGTSSTNNRMYKYANGDLVHPAGPAISSAINPAEVEAWWLCEFRNQCN